MKQRAIIIIITAVLLALTVIAAVIRLNDAPRAEEGSVVFFRHGTVQTLDLSGITLTDISGTIVNGKGEEKQISGKGARLSDVTGTSGFSQVMVTADDEYSASVKADELESAWLLISGDSVSLVVFGDSNAKRYVKNVVRIEVV